MHEELLIDRIDTETFDKTLARYASTVPSKLTDLDELRYVKIPASVHDRGNGPHLTKSELVSLVEWKLSHGKFRPTLKGLALQNAEEAVASITEEAFAQQEAAAALKELIKLRGVGPATASLLISVSRPDTDPFFSDELFRWCFYEAKSGHGWDRQIRYTPKEYSQLTERVNSLRQRLGTGGRTPSAVDIEKVAYVLGKEDTTTRQPAAIKDQPAADKPNDKRKKADTADAIEDENLAAEKSSTRRKRKR